MNRPDDSRRMPRARAFALPVLTLSTLTIAPVQAADAPAAAPAAAAEIVRFHLSPWEQDFGYTQAVRAGPFLYVSGTVGRGDLADPEGMANALRAAYERVRTTLDAHGVGFDRIVKETVYTRDIEALKAAAATRRAFYPEGAYPASSWIQIDRLFEEDYLVEIEVTALLP